MNGTNVPIIHKGTHGDLTVHYIVNGTNVPNILWSIQGALTQHTGNRRPHSFADHLHTYTHTHIHNGVS